MKSFLSITVCLVILSFSRLAAQPAHLQVYKNSCIPENVWTGWVAISQPHLYYDYSSPFTMAEVRITDIPYGGTYDQTYTFNNGNFCNQWPYALTTGRYTWCVRVYYYAMPPGAWTWTAATWGSDFYVDVTAPNPPVVTDNDCGGSHTGWPAWIAHTSPYFTWDNPGDAGSGISHYQVSVNGGGWNNVSSFWHPEYEGSIVFNFRSVDYAGNVSISYVLYVRIDNTAPPQPTVFETDCGSPGIWTNHFTPNFIWGPVLDAGFPVNGSGINRYEVSVNWGSWMTVTSPWTEAFPTGQYIFMFRAVDNVELCSNVEVKPDIYIDASPPTPPIVTEEHCGGSTTNYPPWSSHTSPKFTWSIPFDEGSGVLPTGFSVSVNSGEWSSVVSGWEPTLTSGSYIFDFKSTDRAGNESGTYRIYVRIHEPLIIRVDNDATGSNNGSSWTDAYTDLQTALNNSLEGDTIWVAEGIYKPSADKTGNVSPSDPRTKTYKLKEEVPLYGGFSGTESKRKERDPENNITVLSGDIGTGGVIADNCYSVITGMDNSSIDGFMITGGNGDGSVSLQTDLGGGISNNGISNLKVRNCIFKDNFSKQGGAAGNYFCTDSIIYSDCRFLDNSGYNGGAIGNWDTRVYITNCIFSGNSTSSGNSYGAAIFNWGGESTAQILNCTFFNNIDASSRGAVHNRAAVSTATNCIMWGNNSLDIVNTNGGSTILTYSCIEQSGYAGSNGNISINPEFVDATSRDFHLTSISPCIDAGNGSAAPHSDLEGNQRFDNPLVENTGTGDPLYSDMGVYECFLITNILVSNPDAISVYPNPSNGIFYIEAQDIRRIVITDIYGRLIHDRKAELRNEISLENEPEGLYFVKIYTGNSLFIRKVILR